MVDVQKKLALIRARKLIDDIQMEKVAYAPHSPTADIAKVITGLVTGAGAAYAGSRIKTRHARQLMDSRIKSGLGIGAGLTGLGLGWKLGPGKLLDSREKQLAYREMMRLTPELKSLDQSKIVNYFDALWRINEELAKNPIVAGTFVTNQLSLGMGIPPNMAADMMARRVQRPGLGRTAVETAIKTLTSQSLGGIKE